MEEKIVTLKKATAPIVCLCGSTRFKQAIIWETARLTAEGNIVLGMDLWGHHERRDPDPELKKRLDDIHRKKIDLADLIYVIDVGGYIGESTASEIKYAIEKGKIVRYLSKEFPGYIEPADPMQALLEENKQLREDLSVVLQTIEASLDKASEAQTSEEALKRAEAVADLVIRNLRYKFPEKEIPTLEKAREMHEELLDVIKTYQEAKAV